MKELGKNISSYRKKAGITQEHLAELMHVSVSAVSQWETGKTLPDISMIPILCHVLDVSADDLLGIDAQMREQEIRDILKEAKELIFYNRYAKAERILLSALKRFPKHFEVMEQLMLLYQMKSNDDGNAKSEEDCQKAIHYGEIIAKECPEEKRRILAKQVLCLTYHKLGDEKNAINLAMELPSMNGSLENMLCEVSSGKNKVEFNQIRTCMLLMLLYQAMVQNANVKLADGNMSVTDEEELAILQKFENILFELFEKEDYGFFHTCLQDCNIRKARIYVKNGEKKLAMKELLKSADHAEATLQFDKNAKHVSIFFQGSSYGEFGTANGNNMTADLLEKMKDIGFDSMRKQKEFQALIKRLSETAGKITK